MRSLLALLMLPVLLVLAGGARAQGTLIVQSRFFTTSDGVQLHYLEAGPARGHTIVFVPGWRMPAWIWGPQIAHFSRSFHVVAFDPRGQGDSAVPSTGYDHLRRGQDIAELIALLGPRPVLLAGWSLGVLDSLAYVHAHGDAHLAGLVLVDNSVGEDPAPMPRARPPRRGPKPPAAVAMRQFVLSMFRKPQDADYLDRLAEATLRTPEFASNALLAYPVPRNYWREAVYKTTKPVLYAVRPGFAGQAENLDRRHPGAEIAIFAEAGHALFVDEASRFNLLLDDFIRRKVWPPGFASETGR